MTETPDDGSSLASREVLQYPTPWRVSRAGIRSATPELSGAAGGSRTAPQSQPARELPYAELPYAGSIIRATCIRFHVMKVVLRLVKSFSGTA